MLGILNDIMDKKGRILNLLRIAFFWPIKITGREIDIFSLKSNKNHFRWMELWISKVNNVPSSGNRGIIGC